MDLIPGACAPGYYLPPLPGLYRISGASTALTQWDHAKHDGNKSRRSLRQVLTREPLDS